MLVHDATQACETHVSGPGTLSHAYPPGSRVALCGTTRKPGATQGTSPKCATCKSLATQQHWTGR